MVTESRQERHLMRQRGAGIRDIKTSLFGFTFGFPIPSLHEPAGPLPKPPSPHKSSKKIPATKILTTKTTNVAQDGEALAKREKRRAIVVVEGVKRNVRRSRKEVNGGATDQELPNVATKTEEKLQIKDALASGLVDVAIVATDVLGKRKRGRPAKKDQQNTSKTLVSAYLAGGESDKPTIRPTTFRTRKKAAVAGFTKDEEDEDDEADDEEDAYEPRPRANRAKNVVGKTSGTRKKSKRRIKEDVEEEIKDAPIPQTTTDGADETKRVGPRTHAVIQEDVALSAKPKTQSEAAIEKAQVEEPSMQPLAVSKRGKRPRKTNLAVDEHTSLQITHPRPSRTSELKVQKLQEQPNLPNEAPVLPTPIPSMSRSPIRVHIDPPLMTEITISDKVAVTGRLTRRAAAASRQRLLEIAQLEAEDIAKENEEAVSHSKQKVKMVKGRAAGKKHGNAVLGEKTVNIPIAYSRNYEL